MRLRFLRLLGFKSFAGETIIPIESGITVIVGPNGCGKSNIVEAFRWVMGEGSARRVRADEMDDIIFGGAGGSGGRMRRDFAEVSVILDNSSATVASPYSEFSQLEVSRRIERRRGSLYQINRSAVRARDVQLLFADEGSGASSSSIVGQGQITSLLSSRSVERRYLLEEAAGISGLQARKREAELKLQATEVNLHRLQDLLDNFVRQNRDLQKQARQAQKYRELSDIIEVRERLLLARDWWVSYNDVEGLTARHGELSGGVRDKQRQSAECAALLVGYESKLSPLRNRFVACQAALRRAQIALADCESEEKIATMQLREWQSRLQEAQKDAQHAKELYLDARAKSASYGETLAQMESQYATRQEALDTLKPRLQAALQAKQESLVRYQKCADSYHKFQEAQHTCTQRLAELQRQSEAQQGKIAKSETHLQKLKNRQNAPPHASDNGDVGAVQPQDFASAIRAKDEGHKQSVEILAKARESLQSLTHQRQQTGQAYAAQCQPHQTQLAQQLAETQAVKKLLHQDVGKDSPQDSLISDVHSPKDYQKACAVALGESANAGLSEAAQAYWRQDLPSLDIASHPALPRLKQFIKAPKVLDRRLNNSFIADDMQTAIQHQNDLQAGQIIVTKDGGLCRWDGYIQTPQKISATVQNLKNNLANKNRLAELGELIPQTQAKIESLQSQHARQDKSLENRQQQLQQQIQELENQIAVSVADIKDLYDKQHQHQARVSMEANEVQQLRNEIVFTEERLQQYRLELADTSASEAALQERWQRLSEDNAGEELPRHLKASERELDELQGCIDEHQSQQAAWQGELQYHQQNKAKTLAEQQEWRGRENKQKHRLQDCAVRLEAATEKIKECSDRPRQLAENRQACHQQISLAEAEQSQAAQALQILEQKIALASEQSKAAQSALNQQREQYIRSEAELQHRRDDLQKHQQAIYDRFHLSPSQLLEWVDTEALREGESASDLTELESLKARREAMGAVNLLAEDEAEKLSERISQMQKEQNDLTQAVDKLRQAIVRLNAKARSQLEQAFRAVDENFKSLFTLLFGGGTAELQWVGEQDPLTAGLEIRARPPGKKIQQLSLLSGGEQTLTALALLFAVFISRSALICILDEVDALLDDSNVNRFCNLLEKLAQEKGVQFLVVSHHRLTMARADRLFGVTMPEQGVSRLVSVDMREAEKYHRPAVNAVNP